MKDKEKEINNILNEYKILEKDSKEVEQNEEYVEEKSVINPELTLEQMRNLNEKNLNIQVMIALIKKQDEIQVDEKKANDKLKKIKKDIGNFRYTYDENGIATNSDEMQKMTQKYEKIRREQAVIKGSKILCEEKLSDFEQKTGLTTNNVREMMIREEEKKREYEEQERLRQERIEQEKILAKQREEQKGKTNANINDVEKEREKISNKNYDADDILVIYPYKNTASYIFEGKEGKIENIRELVWGDKSKIFGKYKIKAEEYELTNNKTGETKEYTSKLNPVVFEAFKSNPQKLEDYMELKSKTAILYIFDEPKKKNKDVAKMMYKYQKQDKDVTQKIGYIGFSDKINSRFSYKLGKKVLALPEEKDINETQQLEKILSNENDVDKSNEN